MHEVWGLLYFDVTNLLLRHLVISIATCSPSLSLEENMMKEETRSYLLCVQFDPQSRFSDFDVIGGVGTIPPGFSGKSCL